MNIKIIDGVEHWDIAAEEVAIEAPIDGHPVRWHFRPYATGAAKALLKAISNKFKLLPGNVTEAVSGDPTAFTAFFDAHFLRMSNVAGADGNDLPLEDQIAWLANNPQIKSDVVNILFKPEAIVTEGEEKGDGKTVLILRSGCDSAHRVRCWNDGQTIKLKINHHLARLSARDRLEYDRSISRNRMDSKHGTIQVLVDYDLVETLYDRLVVSVGGACLGEKPCMEANRIEWLKRVPFWWKSFAIDDVFGQDRIKNA